MGTIVHNSQTVNMVYVGSQEVRRIVKNGTTLWENNPTPTEDGYWYGTVQSGNRAIDWSYYYGNQEWQIELDDGGSGTIMFKNGNWKIDISGEVPINIPGNSWDKRLVFTDEYHDRDVDLQWEE